MNSSQAWIAIVLILAVLASIVLIQREISRVGDNLEKIDKTIEDAGGPAEPTPADEIIVDPDEGDSNRAVWSWGGSSASFGDSRTMNEKGIGTLEFLGGERSDTNTLYSALMWEVKIGDHPTMPTQTYTITAMRSGGTFAYYITDNDGFHRVTTCAPADCTGQLPAEFEGWVIGDMLMLPGNVKAEWLETD